jgi:predicted adenylyl cyclase CyaB
MQTKEIECRFLEIDKEALIKKLTSLGAHDEGEKMLEEVIIYDNALTWRDEGKKIRIRSDGDTIKVAYKENKEHTIDSTIEIEFGIDDFKMAEFFFEKIGFVAYRRQQKKRHSFHYKGVTIDIDT